MFRLEFYIKFSPCSASFSVLEYLDGANILNTPIKLNRLLLHMAADVFFHVRHRCQAQLRFSATSKYAHLSKRTPQKRTKNTLKGVQNLNACLTSL